MDFLGVIEMKVAHRLPMIQLLGLEKVIISQDLVLVGFEVWGQEKVEVLEHDGFQLKDDFNIQLMNFIHLELFENAILQRLRINPTLNRYFEAPSIFILLL